MPPISGHETTEGRYARYLKERESAAYKKRYETKMKPGFRAHKRCRSLMLGIIKLELGCKRCGYKTHPAALAFHHRDPSHKTAHVGDMTGYGIARLQAELDKCDVLCENCHRAMTHEGHALAYV